MKFKLLSYPAFILSVLLLLSCQKKDEVGSNAILLADASNVNTTSVVVDQSDVQYNVLVRSVQKIAEGSSVEANIVIDQAYLEAYNEKNQSDFKLLPNNFYTIEASNTTITQGSAFANPIKITIKPLNGLPESDKYVLPITIANAKGLPILNASKSLLLKLDRVITTNAVHFSNANASVTYPSELKDVKSWTFEWRVKMDKLGYNNQVLLTSGGTNSEFFTRFGDVVIRPTQLQLKLGSLGQFSPAKDLKSNTWYHMAIVYDGGSVKWYVDGNLEMNVSVSGIFNFKGIGMGYGELGKSMNEVRFWNIARTQSQIMNNMYSVDPASSGLYGYWKCNEGTGVTLKDATSNHNDMTISKADWTLNIKMPDNSQN